MKLFEGSEPMLHLQNDLIYFNQKWHSELVQKQTGWTMCPVWFIAQVISILVLIKIFKLFSTANGYVFKQVRRDSITRNVPEGSLMCCKYAASCWRVGSCEWKPVSKGHAGCCWRSDCSRQEIPPRHELYHLHRPSSLPLISTGTPSSITNPTFSTASWNDDSRGCCSGSKSDVSVYRLV